MRMKLVIVSFLSIGMCFGTPTRSSIGAVHSRFSSVAEESVSAKDYVQDGLVAMWDGIENAGWGVHDPNATVWKDLVGASEIPLNDAWSFGDNNLYVPMQPYGGSHIPIIIPTGETGQFDLCFSASGYTANYGWILDGGLGLGNASGPCFSSPLGANSDFPAGTSTALRFWTESTLEIKRPYAYSVSFDGSNGRRITDGVISKFRANTGNFNGVTVFNAYNYNRPVTGRIFNIRLYSRALTADEIAHNYAIDKARFNL